jgi:hypothetical protein
LVLKDREKKLSVDEQDLREKQAASHAKGSHDKTEEIAELSQRKEVSVQAAHIEERRLSELEESLLEPQDPAAEEDDQGRFWGWDGSHATVGEQMRYAQMYTAFPVCMYTAFPVRIYTAIPVCVLSQEGGQPRDPGAHLSLGDRCCSERTPSDKSS